MKFYLFLELVGCISLKYLRNFQCIYFIMTCRQKQNHSNDCLRTNDISTVTIKDRSSWKNHSLHMMVLHLCIRTKRKEKAAYSIIDSGICIDASFVSKFFTIL